MNGAAVRLDAALAEQRVVGRQFLHFGDDLGAIMRIAAERFQRLEVMQQARIDPGMHHGRHAVIFHALLKSLREGPARVVEVPVERFGEIEALRGVETERVNVGDEQQQRRELLAAGSDAELGGLLPPGV